ncbi:unnamed protein product [Phyllotreta striolata]|uniref:Rho GTPase-activating protein 7 n=1 Tax=Phyllotreta striolata TaxID=444603 RepID=A0A9N9XKH5_PHYSR|nr:unnamed protein product [Phyllotreta striolata]
MSSINQYQDLLNYLEESQNEIAKVFEVSSKNENSAKEKEQDEDRDPDDDLNCLIKLNEKIESDLIELLSKSKFKSQQNGFDNGYFPINGQNSDAEQSSLYLNYERSVIDRSTQTSPPSLSLSSTNLTWGSSSSSSPCLSSPSTSDLEEYTNDIVTLTDVPNIPEKKTYLGCRFSSTPILKTNYNQVNKQSRSQSDRRLTEIEAAEACKWLRATGFPQYAQLYEDNQFPIEISTVAQDHPLLESDILHSLFRRLQILNSCAHLHQQKIVNTEDESEDESCALSNNWTYQVDIKRWSRNCNKVPTSDYESASKDPEITKDTQRDRNKAEVKKVGSIRESSRKKTPAIVEKNNAAEHSSQISRLKLAEFRHSSDSEETPRTSRRVRTQSLDKTDSWSTTNIKINRLIWSNPLEHEHVFLEDDTDIPQDIEGPPLYQLCASQIQVLRKLALLKLTAHMEKYCPAHRTGWTWDLPRFFRKMKSPIYKDRHVFGVPLMVIFQRCGKILPRHIEEAMQWLQENASDQVGIFRKSGVKSRIQMLRNKIESNSMIDYTEQQCYDVADMLKQYFRELPEMLFTAKLSETFVLIFQYIPAFLRLESVICAIILMPEEHSQVLQALLHFLLIIANKSDVNQMNEHNLAMCLAPTLFHSSCLYKHVGGSPHSKELAENKAAQECLFFFLKFFHILFKIPKDFINQCNSSEIKEIKPKQLTDIGDGIGGWKEYLKECHKNLLKEVKEKSRGWMPIPVQNSLATLASNSKIAVFYKKVADGMPLRLWKVVADIEAPPAEVAHRILRERHIWDFDLISAKIIAQLDQQTEIFQYIRKKVTPIPNEEYCVIRTWRSDLPKDSCTIIETSVEYPGTIQVPGSIRGIVLASRYHIEPCGSGKSRLIHFSRIDTMGRSPEWYQKNYGYLSAVFIRNLQNSFYQNTNCPESQV